MDKNETKVTILLGGLQASPTKGHRGFINRMMTDPVLRKFFDENDVTVRINATGSSGDLNLIAAPAIKKAFEDAVGWDKLAETMDAAVSEAAPSCPSSAGRSSS